MLTWYSSGPFWMLSARKYGHTFLEIFWDWYCVQETRKPFPQLFKSPWPRAFGDLGICRQRGHISGPGSSEQVGGCTWSINKGGVVFMAWFPWTQPKQITPHISYNRCDICKKDWDRLELKHPIMCHRGFESPYIVRIFLEGTILFSVDVISIYWVFATCLELSYALPHLQLLRHLLRETFQWGRKQEALGPVVPPANTKAAISGELLTSLRIRFLSLHGGVWTIKQTVRFPILYSSMILKMYFLANIYWPPMTCHTLKF